MNKWIYIDEIDNLPTTSTIHCDTRDFHVICPDSTAESLNNLILKHSINLEIKQQYKTLKKYKYTLDELNSKRKELGTWQAVADYYQVNISTLKRHRKELE